MNKFGGAYLGANYMRPGRSQTGTAWNRFPYESLFLFTWDRFEKEARTGITDSGCWTDPNEFRPVQTRTGTKFSSREREISIDQPLTWERIWNALLLGTKTRNLGWNVCKNMALVSFWCHVNTSENFKFGSGLNSCRSHVISPLLGHRYAGPPRKQKMQGQIGSISKFIVNMYTRQFV